MAAVVDQTSRSLAAAASSAPRYEPFIEGIRGLLALYVVLHHIYSVTGSFNEGSSENLRDYLDWFSYGHNAVAAFIFVSGLCLGMPVVRNLESGLAALPKGAGHFYRARGRRILPAYYAALLIGIAIGAVLFRDAASVPPNYFFPLKADAVIGSLLLVPNLVGGQNGSGVIWSLGVELQIYLLFPLMCRVWQRGGLVTLLCLTVVLASAAGAHLPKAVGPLQLLGSTRGLHPTFYVVFVMGLIGAKVLRGHSELARSLRQRVPWGVLLLSVIAVLFLRDFVFGLRGDMNDYLIGGLMLLAVMAVQRHRAVRWLLEREPPVKLGTFSYSLYLVHLLVLHLTFVFVYRNVLPLAMQGQFFRAIMFQVAVGLPLACGAAWAFARVFERPFMNSRARREAADHYHPPAATLVAVNSATSPAAPPTAVPAPAAD